MNCVLQMVLVVVYTPVDSETSLCTFEVSSISSYDSLIAVVLATRIVDLSMVVVVVESVSVSVSVCTLFVSTP